MHVCFCWFHTLTVTPVILFQTRMNTRNEYSGPCLIWMVLSTHCQTWNQQYSACCLWMTSACCHPSLLHSARSGLCLSHCCLWPTCRRKSYVWWETVWSHPACFSHRPNPMLGPSHRPDLAPNFSTMEVHCKFNTSVNMSIKKSHKQTIVEIITLQMKFSSLSPKLVLPFWSAPWGKENSVDVDETAILITDNLR